MTEKLKIEKATFRDVTRNGAVVPVHFNPETLQITLTNTLEEKQRGGKKTQYITKSTAKLTMDLVFDTTDTRNDVRAATGTVAAFMSGVGAGARSKTPPVVLFEWGSFSFQGVLETYKETLEYFSHQGVPLRANVNLALARQDLVFSADGGSAPKPDAVDVPPSSTDDVTSAASRAGDPGAARETGARNGLENLRFPDGPFTIDGSISLGAPAAFASGSLSAGASASFGASASAGFGASAGAGFGASAEAGFGASAGAGFGGGASASFGGGAGASFGGNASASLGGGAGAGFGGGAAAGFGGGAVAGFSAGSGASFSAGSSFAAGGSVSGPVFGASASAGVTANRGAFAGLRAGARARIGPLLDPSKLLPPVESRAVGLSGEATFRVGGRANATGTAGLTATGAVTSGIRFEED